MLVAASNAPIHMLETTSSTPNHLEKPRPLPTATMQIGQTALAVFASINPKNKKNKNADFFLNIISCFD